MLARTTPARTTPPQLGQRPNSAALSPAPTLEAISRLFQNEMVSDFVQRRVVLADGLAPRPSTFAQRVAWSGNPLMGPGARSLRKQVSFYHRGTEPRRRETIALRALRAKILASP